MKKNNIYIVFLLLVIEISCSKLPNNLNEQDEYDLTTSNFNIQFNGNNSNQLNYFFTNFIFKPTPPEQIDFPIDPDQVINNQILNKPECDITNADNRDELIKLLGLPTNLTTQEFYYSYVIDEAASKILFTSISIKNIELNQIPNLKCFSALENLSLTGNKLTILDPNFFQDLHGLLFLDLSNNNFTIVPEAIKNLKNLIVLSFSNNQINDLNTTKIKYEDFTNLKTLIFSKNQLETIEPLAKIPALEALYLSGNKLDLTDNKTLSFFEYKKLNTLDISSQESNTEMPFPAELLTKGFEKLSTLYYRNNKIDMKTIDDDFLNKLATKSWINLYLEYNNLDTKTGDNIRNRVSCTSTDSSVLPTTTDPMILAAILAGQQQGLTIEADSTKKCLYLKPQT